MGTAAYEIPLSPTPQKFTCALGGTEYRLVVKWNHVAACWVLDIYTLADASVVLGIPLVTGYDLLAQYAYLGFGVELHVQTDDDADAVPTFDNLGTNGHLFIVVSE